MNLTLDKVADFFASMEGTDQRVVGIRLNPQNEGVLRVFDIEPLCGASSEGVLGFFWGAEVRWGVDVHLNRIVLIGERGLRQEFPFEPLQ